MICFFTAVLLAVNEDTVSSMQMAIPAGMNNKAVATPADLLQTVKTEWDDLVGHNDAGLVPAEQEGKPQPPLGEEEAWYQYQRTQSGEIDSARFLLVFGMVPSIKSGGSALHNAAAIGDAKAVQ